MVAAQRMLGRRVKIDERKMLKLGNYASTSRLPAPPDSINNHSKISRWEMYDNDTIGDCAIAAPGHAITIASAVAQQSPIVPLASLIRSDYMAVSGWDGIPGSPTDAGCDMLKVMARWRNDGIGGRKILAWACIPAGNGIQIDQTLVATAMWLFSSLQFGYSLPAAVKDADEWVAPSRHHAWGKWRAGSWGGHAVTSGKYDNAQLPPITWGQEMPQDWAFLDMYCDQILVPILEDWFNPTTKLAPSGFDLEALLADARSIKALN